MRNEFSEDLQILLRVAGVWASKFRQDSISPVHLLFAMHLERASEVGVAFRSVIAERDLRRGVFAAWKQIQLDGPSGSCVEDFDTEASELIEAAHQLARETQFKATTAAHLAYVLLSDEYIQETLSACELTAEEYVWLCGQVSYMIENGDGRGSGARRERIVLIDPRLGAFGPEIPEFLAGFAFDQRNQSSARRTPVSRSLAIQRFAGPNEKREESEDHSALGKFGVDLTRRAREGKLDPVIGREKEIKRCLRILARRTKNNPVLIGEPGVGKTAIAEGVAIVIASGNVVESLKNKRVIMLDLALMVAGTKYRGEYEERMKSVLKEVLDAGNVILFIDELHTVIGGGAAEGGLDASNMLKPALSRRELSCMGATTLKEYNKYFKDGAFKRRFLPVFVEPPSVAETVEILRGVRAKLQEHHKLTISDEALVAAAEQSNRYISDRFLPDKAIDLVDEACSWLSMKLQETAATTGEALASGEVGVQNIAEIVSAWTGVPVGTITQSENERLRRMEEELHKRVIGQRGAITAVSNHVRKSRVGLKTPNRPIGSFIFLGPTGVGKTELARALQNFLFEERPLIKFDMSEYMEKVAVNKFIGAPPGYVGYEEGGQLTEAVKNRPFSVVLLDEIEKAHPDVFNVLLQIMEDGQLTDGKGNTVDFKNVILIMTSNIGVSTLEKKRIGFDTGATTEAIPVNVIAELKRVFRPEFINRLDEIIAFHKLDSSHLKQIIEIMLAGVRVLLEPRRITLRLTDAAKELIIREGTNEEFGARPLYRAVDRWVTQKISNAIVGGTVTDGMTIEADVVNDGTDIVFRELKG